MQSQVARRAFVGMAAGQIDARLGQRGLRSGKGALEGADAVDVVRHRRVQPVERGHAAPHIGADEVKRVLRVRCGDGGGLGAQPQPELDGTQQHVPIADASVGRDVGPLASVGGAGRGLEARAVEIDGQGARRRLGSAHGY